MTTTYHADHDTTAHDPIVTHWTSADGQRDIEVGPAPLSQALAEMLDMGTDEDAAWIMAGSFEGGTMTTTYYRPRITPQTRTHEIVDQVAAALQAGHAVRLGRWRAVYDDFSKLFDIDFGSDTQENRAGAEPDGGWWAETCKEWPGEAADVLVSLWLADNGGAA